MDLRAPNFFDTDKHPLPLKLMDIYEETIHCFSSASFEDTTVGRLFLLWPVGVDHFLSVIPNQQHKSPV